MKSYLIVLLCKKIKHRKNAQGKAVKMYLIVLFQLQELRNVNKEGGEHLLISGNIRPTMALNNRLVRTNINYRPAVCSFLFKTRCDKIRQAAQHADVCLCFTYTCS